MGDTNDIEYFLLTMENLEEVIEFIDNDFLTREPLTMGSHLKPTSATGKLGIELRKTLVSGVSFGARDSKTGVLIGCRLSYLKNRGEKPTEEPCEKTEIEKRVLSIVDELGSKVDVFQDPDVDKVLYMFMLSVHRNYGGRGIARRLVEMSMERGKALGCQLAFTTISNVLSGRVFQRLGYETRYTLDMSTPEGNRGLDLSSMQGNKLVHIMTKRL